MRENQTIDELLEDCTRYFEQNCYTRVRIERYKSMWRNGVCHYMQASGITYYNRQGAYVHSLRHTFAVHSLMKMTKSGYDLYYTLPILSTYLGHRSIGATEQYVRLTEEMYPELLKDQREICSYVFPEIKMTGEDGNN